MKALAFVILSSAAAISFAAPAAAQSGRTGADFVEAVRSGDGGKATDLLSDKGAQFVNSRALDGDTALVIAIRRRDEDFTGFLLNKGADPNLAGKGGELPLVEAARVGFDTGVEWLLSLGAKVDGANRDGETALITAVQQRQLPVIRRLLQAGANPDRADNAQGFSAREYAARDPRSREILKLIEQAKPKR